MSPQRRIAVVSVVAAIVLIAVKLATGLATGSLGFLSEAAHSGTDLVAALLTLFAIGVAVRPADPGHPYGHGKAEHLAALAEASILVAISLGISYTAIRRLAQGTGEVEATWYAFLVICVVIAIDASRTVVSLRASRRYRSPAFGASALHFGSDLAGSTAVLVGLLVARAGHPEGDAAAALFVALLVLAAAGRLIRRNVDVLMDRAPDAESAAARRAIEELGPGLTLHRLRMRRAAGRHFADVVIGVSPGAAVGQAHAAADAVEEAVERAVPDTDVVVHVEPAGAEAGLREQALAAALAVPRVREVHNVTVLEVGDHTEVSLHLKLPGSLTLAEAHSVATLVEREILAAVPDVDAVQTHLEPLAEPAAVRSVPQRDLEAESTSVRRIVREVTGADPRELRFLATERGVVAFLTLAMEPERALADAHARASEIEERIRRDHPAIAEVIVHTEP
ncbi:MAG: cation diffusion facilitator family transporter [Gaiellaceae bacterium]